MKKIIALCTLVRRSFGVGGLTIALCSCGFTPMYSDNLQTNSADVFIAPISGTNGIDLRNNLRAQFGGGNEEAGAKYILTVDLKNPQNIYKGIQRTGDATWQEVRLTASYVLKDASGAEIIKGSETASESYTFVIDLVAANASQSNAVQNTINMLSQKISMRVGAAIRDQ